MTRRVFTLWIVGALLAAAHLLAYTIVLRDGSTIQAKGAYRVQGERALITLQNGTQTFLGLAEIDVEKTEAANREGYEGAQLIADGEASQRPAAPPKPRGTLAGAASEQRSTLGRPSAPPAHDTAPSGRLRGAAGELDFAALPRRPYPEAPVVELLTQHFTRHKFATVEVLRGSEADRVLLAVTASSEGEVFRSIALAATALDLLSEAGHQEIAAVELLMLTAEGGQAGQFLLTPDIVQPLLAGELEVPDFYVQNVRF